MKRIILIQQRLTEDHLNKTKNNDKGPNSSQHKNSCSKKIKIINSVIFYILKV
ncbi:MAG: hypothetical protein ACLTFB_02320 [Candidatus Phytoplasma pyri]